LEELIRLKRAERPPQEFWSEFENELRRKQLAAIVDKRPWWRRVSAINLARLSMPAGAAAILAFTLFAYRDSFVSAPDSAAEIVMAAPAATAGQVSVETGQLVSTNERAGDVSAEAVPHASADTGEIPARSGKEHSYASAMMQDIPLLDDSDVRVAQVEKETSLAQLIMGLESEHSVSARPHFELAGSALEIPSVVSQLGERTASANASAPVDSLSRLASAMDGRRARLLVSVDAQERGTFGDNPRVARTRDRIASRLDERALSDSISRLGVNGDSVSIKF
jgi:hypothetical protein